MSYELSFTNIFPYSFIGNNYKPIIPVAFSYNEYEYSYPMYVDSGSLVTSLPPEHAKAFGIEDLSVLPERRGCGIGGTSYYRVLEGVNIIIVDRQIELKAPICFVENMMGWDFGLLGREAVFSKLQIAFKERKGPYIYIALDNSA